ITLELACGRGDLAIALAKRYPDRNFIGVDIKGARLWNGARRVLDEGLENVQFLRIYIEHLADYFASEEVAEIWITFPDPFLKSRDARKRLTSPRFLSLYRRVLKPGGIVHLKTDSRELFEYTLSIFEEEPVSICRVVRDIYREAPGDPFLALQTTYEKRHLEDGRVIRYLTFQFED
ncbi:MAG: tRNA (guanosine(46)-N7)-methyltransferase TrmB, partial [Balneolaceae bacterium]